MTRQEREMQKISYSFQLGIIIFVVAFVSSLIVYSSRPDVEKTAHDLSMMELSGNYYSVSLENESIVFETYSYLTDSDHSMIYEESE